MRFMLLMIPKGYEKATPGAMPDAKAVEAMMKYNESLQKAGVLLTLDGLHPPSMGARVTFSGGKPTVIDGPFAEAKELIAGYTLIQGKSRDEALEWTRRFPNPSPDGAGVAQIEVRPFYELEDFAPGEAVDKFKELRAELEQAKARA